MIGQIKKVSAARDVHILGNNGILYSGKFDDCTGFFPRVGLHVHFDAADNGNAVVKKSVKISIALPSGVSEFSEPKVGNKRQNNDDFKSASNDNHVRDWRMSKSIYYIISLWMVCGFIGEIFSGLGWFLFIFLVIPLTVIEILKVTAKVLSGVMDITGR